MMHPSALGVSQAAAGALVAAVWQGFLLAVVAWAGLKLVSKTPAAVRFAIWFAVFLVVAGLPVVSLLRPAAGVGGGHGAWLTLNAWWCVGIVGAWVLASLVRAGTLVVAGFRLRALWKRAECMEVEGADFLHPTHRDEAVMDGARRLLRPTHRDEAAMNGALGLSEAVGMSAVELSSMPTLATIGPSRRWGTRIGGARTAQVCVSDEVDRPSVIGFFAPKILIPRWLIEKLTTDELRQIVLHETGHLGRADDWMNLLQKIALVVFPLNPALAWVERRLCFERELACDERVLAETGAPKAYAACLAGLAEYRLERRGGALRLALGFGGALGRESELGRRVRRILERGKVMRPVHARLVLGGAMLGLMFGAVELGRCPAVVAFTGARAEASGASLQAGVDTGRGGNGFGVRAVVFHPDAARGGSGLEPTHRDGAAMNGAPTEERGVTKKVQLQVSPLRRQNAPSSVEMTDFGRPERIHRRQAGMTAADFRRGQQQVAGQWIVVTSWSGADGSRMVMTTIRDSGDVRPMSSQDEVRKGLRDQDDQYAAVPVRGGWLLFQL